MHTMTMLYGGDGTQAYRANPDGNSSQREETLTSTTRRRFRGPQIDGLFSLNAFVTELVAVTSATGLTVWYSNLPDPLLADDDDWVQDTTIGTALVLTDTGKCFTNVGNISAEWVMIKADITAGSLGIRVFTRTFGPNIR